MNEIQFWSRHVKPALNVQHRDRVAWKVGTSTRAGIPDVLYRSGTAVAWLELKRLPTWPARPHTPLRLGLSPEQRAHLRDWCLSGQGAGFVLAAVDQDVLVLPWYVPDEIERPEQLKLLTLAWMDLKRVKAYLGDALDTLIISPPSIVREGQVMAVLEDPGSS